MPAPTDRRYSETHEWHKLEGPPASAPANAPATITIGLTQFAVDALTDVTYVQMKPRGTVIGAGEIVGEVESVKTTSDIYSAVPGEIIEVNPRLETEPGLLNSDPFGEGWLIKVRTTDTSAYDKLMDPGAYDATVAKG